MVSSAFSKKSSRQGLMTISSGRVWRATQAYSLAVFTPPLPLPLAAKKHGSLSILQPGLYLDNTRLSTYGLFFLTCFRVFLSAGLIDMHESTLIKHFLWIQASTYSKG